MGVILTIIQAILGIAVLFFVVGWLFMNKHFHGLILWKKILYSMTLSICVSVFLGLVLGYIGIFGLASFLIAYLVTVLIVIFI